LARDAAIQANPDDTTADARRAIHTDRPALATPASTTPSTIPAPAPTKTPRLAPKNVPTTGMSIVPTTPPMTAPAPQPKQMARANTGPIAAKRVSAFDLLIWGS
jgi:hypothetical protein